jgi:hypothetical protein
MFVTMMKSLDPAETNDSEEEIFRAIVALSWADSLKDPRQDLYTLADGVPINPVTGDIAAADRPIASRD